MSRSLMNCTLHPGWVKPFLAAIKNGYNEMNAANMSGVGTNAVRQRCESTPDFKADYDVARANAKPRYGHGPW